MKIQEKKFVFPFALLAGFLATISPANADNHSALSQAPQKQISKQAAGQPSALVAKTAPASQSAAGRVTLTGPQKTLVSSVKNLREAAKLTVARKWPQAYAAYTNVIKANPELGIAYAERAVTLIFMKRYKEAVNDCNKAIALHKDTFEVYNRRAAAYLQMKQYDLALADFTRVINMHPASAAAYRDRAICYLRKGDKKSAQRDIAMAKKALGGKLPDPKRQEKSSFLAVSGSNIVDLGSVPIEKVDEVIKKDPAHKPVYMLQRATMNMFQGKPQKALEDVDQVLKLSDADLATGGCPPRDKIQQLRMTALNKLGRHADAIIESQNVLKTHSDDEQARLILAMSYFETGKYQEAKQEADKIKKNPKLAAAAKILSSKANAKLGPEKKGKGGK